jgi:hypothetical protein
MASTKYKIKTMRPGSNHFRDTYNRSTHTLFDHLKTQQNNTQASASKFQGVITGNPYSDYPINNISRKTLSSKSSIDLGKSKHTGTFDNNTVKAINIALNNDQAKNYIINRSSKYGKTQTIERDAGGKSSRVHHKNNPFRKDFGVHTQSKLRDHEAKRPHTSAVNHSRDFYDPITRSRKNKTSNNSGMYNKSQTISAFNHLGRHFAPNLSNEYQKQAAGNGGNFARTKGMCTEMLNGSQKHAFIATPFGTRS